MMRKLISNLNGNQRLAFAAVMFGLVAFIIGTPSDNTRAEVNTKELTVTAASNVDKVNVDELADWIIKGKYDYRLVDVRSAEEYEKYNIPYSENIILSELLDSDLMRNEKILLYSDDGISSAQAWFIMKASQFKHIYLVDGGMKNWKETILFPTLPGDADAAQLAEFEKAKEVSKYFGGVPQIAGGTISAPTMELPKPTIRKNPIGTSSRKKKKREGC
jgi:rhodanese-related sulfurtransferase